MNRSPLLGRRGRTLFRWHAASSLIFAMGLLSGCADKVPALADVSGKVTIADKPVTAGTVFFLTKDGVQSASAVLSPTGTYHVAGAPVGDVLIAVQTRAFQQKASVLPKITAEQAEGKGSIPLQMKEDPNVGVKYVPIPVKYEEPNTSGLTYTITNGVQTHDIVLTK